MSNGTGKACFHVFNVIQTYNKTSGTAFEFTKKIFFLLWISASKFCEIVNTLNESDYFRFIYKHVRGLTSHFLDFSWQTSFGDVSHSTWTYSSVQILFPFCLSRDIVQWSDWNVIEFFHSLLMKRHNEKHLCCILLVERTHFSFPFIIIILTGWKFAYHPVLMTRVFVKLNVFALINSVDILLLTVSLRFTSDSQNF